MSRTVAEILGPTHMLAGAQTAEHPPSTPFPLTASDALELAAWYTNYALDSLAADPRCQHPAVKGHAKAALTQHAAVQRTIGQEA